jgi:hypothetical protein
MILCPEIDMNPFDPSFAFSNLSSPSKTMIEVTELGWAWYGAL